MPKLFEYLGILIYFYYNEHEPIHVHAKKAEYESKAEFYIIEGIITEVKITEVKGKKPIIGNDLKNFEIFLENYSEKVVQKWVDYFVYHKDVKFEKITKKIR
ncbi:DUF4160 domain-containing protein [Flavobacterium sp. ZT3R18]|uniref:DUF4160 domain-containing protein n=1 Tax=Flavobacterium sp. ZT3R18 TaxID=2594429 RepID=UPI00117BDBED|nr:DUF4160 domain-containing protein [Flavobacterium sp. ZT3R18]